MSIPFPARLVLPAELSLALMEAAEETIRQTVKLARTPQRTTRSRRGTTLKPGPASPLWNELAKIVLARLTRYGDKAQLARLLGLPRQRVNDLLLSRRHLPDAERTLLLLVWLQMRSENHEPFGKK
ncbi:MAG: hypothetical protein HY302_02710 [Opitutae bacterium]|nr:hypothetical protein [Opitutae bacterium]